MKSILVLGNGEFPKPNLLHALVREAEIIICCDGSADKLLLHKIMPDYVVGDLDSISPQTRKRIPASKLISVRNQNKTDVEKVFDFLTRKRWSDASVSLVGITGLRTDFTLYNLHLLRRYGDWDLAVYDDFFMVSLIDRYFEIHGIGIGAMVSLLPAEGPVRVTAQGLKYPVKNALLKQGVHESISNRSTSDTVMVRSNGPLFVFIAHEFSRL